MAWALPTGPGARPEPLPMFRQTVRKRPLSVVAAPLTHDAKRCWVAGSGEAGLGSHRYGAGLDGQRQGHPVADVVTPGKTRSDGPRSQPPGIAPAPTRPCSSAGRRQSPVKASSVKRCRSRAPHDPEYSTTWSSRSRVPPPRFPLLRVVARRVV
jgi:hypothetical protein